MYCVFLLHCTVLYCIPTVFLLYCTTYVGVYVFISYLNGLSLTANLWEIDIHFHLFHTIESRHRHPVLAVRGQGPPDLAGQLGGPDERLGGHAAAVEAVPARQVPTYLLEVQ